MPLNHDIAIASVHVTGLSIGCYNPSAKRWEVGFIRDREHNLAMTVIKHTNSGDEMLFSVCNFHPKAQIQIEASKAIQPANPFFNCDGDPEDFRLILDVEKEIYGEEVGLRKGAKKKVTPLLVMNPIFYAVAGKLSKYPRLLVNKRTGQKSKFRKITSTVGADLRCRTGGSLVITVEGPKGFEVFLPDSRCTRYSIFFDNRCLNHLIDPYSLEEGPRYKETNHYSGAAERPHSDFTLYYRLIIPPRGMPQYDLEEDSDRGPGAVCEKSFLGLKNGMFPLR